MRIVLDTTIIVEIAKDHIIIISAVTVSEILAGSYLRKNFSKAVQTAKQIMGQFLWTDLDGPVAEKIAQYLAYLIVEGKIIEYPDIAIAATFKIEDADYLLTLNKPHFESLPDLKGRVFTPMEFAKFQSTT